MIGMKTFGASALLNELQKKFGFAPDQIVGIAKGLLGKGVRKGEGYKRPFAGGAPYPIHVSRDLGLWLINLRSF
jgi:hypothetical protein